MVVWPFVDEDTEEDEAEEDEVDDGEADDIDCELIMFGLGEVKVMVVVVGADVLDDCCCCCCCCEFNKLCWSFDDDEEDDDDDDEDDEAEDEDEDEEWAGVTTPLADEDDDDEPFVAFTELSMVIVCGLIWLLAATVTNLGLPEPSVVMTKLALPNLDGKFIPFRLIVFPFVVGFNGDEPLWDVSVAYVVPFVDADMLPLFPDCCSVIMVGIEETFELASLLASAPPPHWLIFDAPLPQTDDDDADVDTDGVASWFVFSISAFELGSSILHDI